MPRGIYKRPSPKECFEKHVELIPFTDCHVWTSAISNSGYGQVTISRKLTTAHRAAFELYNGPIPEGMNVLHSCDNRSCVNPKHLFLGTQRDNMIDKLNKKRGKLAKLSNEDVVSIRNKYNTGNFKQEDIAVEYGVSGATISVITSRKSWKHL